MDYRDVFRIFVSTLATFSAVEFMYGFVVFHCITVSRLIPLRRMNSIQYYVINWQNAIYKILI